MLGQSRQHNYMYWHNIRPCPFFFLLVCDLSISLFHFISLTCSFCVSPRFTCTFFGLRFLFMFILLVPQFCCNLFLSQSIEDKIERKREIRKKYKRQCIYSHSYSVELRIEIQFANMWIRIESPS